MSGSRELVQDEQELIRYLLGLLPAEEAERLDEASIVDDEVAFRLRRVEDDLVDAYVSGTLDRNTRERFESFYLASPRRREKVKFAERFLKAIDRTPEGVAPGSDPPGATRMGPFAPRPERNKRFAVRWTFGWPLTLAALLLLACGVLLFEDIRMRHYLNQAEGEIAASDQRARSLAQQVDEGRAANAATAKALELARAASAGRQEQPPAGSSPSVHAPASTALTTVALVLSPQTRAVVSVVTIAVPPDADRVPLELRLDSNDYARYQVVLKDPGANRSLWRSNVIPAQSRRGIPFVPIVLPAGVLEPQHYSLELAGLDTAGHAETVSSYAFFIDR